MTHKHILKRLLGRAILWLCIFPIPNMICNKIIVPRQQDRRDIFYYDEYSVKGKSVNIRLGMCFHFKLSIKKVDISFIIECSVMIQV